MKHVAGSERSTECIIKGQEKMGSGSKNRFPYRDFFPPNNFRNF